MRLIDVDQYAERLQCMMNGLDCRPYASSDEITIANNVIQAALQELFNTPIINLKNLITCLPNKDFAAMFTFWLNAFKEKAPCKNGICVGYQNCEFGENGCCGGSCAINDTENALYSINESGG